MELYTSFDIFVMPLLCLDFYAHFLRHCFICRLSDSTVSEDVGIEHRTVATSALAVRRSNPSDRSHPLVEILSHFYVPQHSFMYVTVSCRF
jgi:hypothetical protein